MVKTNQEIAIDAYNLIAKEYKNISLKNKKYIDSINNLIKDFIKCKKIIDIGSGDGKRIHTLFIESKSDELVCIEPSTVMYNELKQYSDIRSFNICGQEKISGFDAYFDVATSLWNVLGHVADKDDLDKTLRNIRDYLKPGGIFILDVNNRLNGVSYGFLIAGYRFIIDKFFFKRSRGDVRTKWQIKENIIEGYGHVFSPFEIKSALKMNGFTLIKVKYVNYKNGRVSNNPFKGQLFIVAQKN